MKILLTNDDGIRAPGIAALHAEVRKLGEVMTVAPLHAQSASAHGVTFESPLFAYDVTISDTLQGFGVEGLPADCVKVALNCLCEEHLGGLPDIVISGMNAGANAGINTVYSGTVAAALEAALQGIPSLAVSLLLENWETTRYDVAAVHARETIERILATGPLEANEMLNINLPATEEEATTPPMRVCVQNLSHHRARYERRHSPRGNPYYWATGHGLDFHYTTDGTDVDVLARGEIAVTPLRFDLTDHPRLERWKQRLHPDE